MAESSVKLEHGIKEKEITRQLFGEVIGDLADYVFEGSKEEHQIFEEIFYETRVKAAHPPVPTNCGDSSMKDSSGQAYESAKGKFSYTRHLEQEIKSAELINCLDACTKLAQLYPSNVLPTKDPLYEPTLSMMHLDHEMKGSQHNSPDTSSELLPDSDCDSDLPIKELGKKSVQCSVKERREPFV